MADYQRTISPDTTTLILGDSQLISGWEADSTFHLLKSKEPQKIIKWARPSEQPEGILLNLELALKKTNKLNSIILNISPISTSQNSVTSAHQRLYLLEGNFDSILFKEENLLNAYFKSPLTMLHKVSLIFIPLLRLNPSFSVYTDSFLKTGHLDLGEKEKQENLQMLDRPFHERTTWTWRSYQKEKVLSESDIYPQGFGSEFAKPRELAISLWKSIFQKLKVEGIQCYLVELPFSPDLEADLESLGIRQQHRIIVKSLLEDSNCNYQEINGEEFKARDLFADWTHLNEKGRKAVSAWLLSGKISPNN